MTEDKRVSRDSLVGLALLHGITTIREIVRVADSAQFCVLAAAVEELVERLKEDSDSREIPKGVQDILHDILLVHEVLHELRSVAFGAEAEEPDVSFEEESPVAPDRVVMVVTVPKDKNDIN